MTYYKKCPFCNYTVKSGHGDPIQRLGSPLVKCGNCKKIYVDSDIIEWEISPTYRRIGYYFANNRKYYCLIPSIFFSGMVAYSALSMILSFTVCFCLLFLICYIKVKSEITEEIELSKKRISNKQYVEYLIKSGYPVKNSNWHLGTWTTYSQIHKNPEAKASG